MILILLPIAIYLAIKKPTVLYRYLFLFVFMSLLLFLFEGVLGVFALRDTQAKVWHSVLSHFLVIFNTWLCMVTVPAMLIYSVRQKDFLGFRKVPTGILTFCLILFVTYTAYLNPRDPQQATATLRYIVFHHYMAPGLALLAYVRWLLILKQRCNEK